MIKKFLNFSNPNFNLMRQKLLLLTTVLTLAFATGQLSAQCVGATPGFCERPLIILPGGYFPGITVMNPDPMSGGVWSCREDFEAYLTSPGPFFFFAYDIDPAMCPFPSGTAPLCFNIPAAVADRVCKW